MKPAYNGRLAIHVFAFLLALTLLSFSCAKMMLGWARLILVLLRNGQDAELTSMTARDYPRTFDFANWGQLPHSLLVGAGLLGGKAMPTFAGSRQMLRCKKTAVLL
jgi:hypothetical protein